jgi:hypothetical protein
VVDTTVQDGADPAAQLQWGGIAIQRAWLQYDVNQFLSIRAGHWLTPYGIWNVDHGTPTIIAARRPFIIGVELFPRSQTGLQALGAYSIGDHLLRYHLTLSNGRGPTSTHKDEDEQKAIGARLELETQWLDGIDFGISGYRGRFTNTETSISIDAGSLKVVSDIEEQYDENGLAVDLRLRAGGLAIDAEAILKQHRYTSAGRPRAGMGLLPDGQRYGGYLLASYRLQRFHAAPYYLLEYYNDNDSVYVRKAIGNSVGINVRATPSVILKAQYGYFQFNTPAGSILNNEAIHAINTQLAWVF